MRHPIFSRLYARRSVAQAETQKPDRQDLLAGLSGRVLEIGCGNGLNFEHYPPQVTQVIAIEPEPYLRSCAVTRAREHPQISVVAGTAERVSEVVAGPFDAVVFSLVLCSVDDPALVLRESQRVMTRAAAVRFYEHVLSDDAKLARAQRRFAFLWSLVAGGCRPDRDTLTLIAEHFEILSVRRFDSLTGPRLPINVVAPHILVAARHGAGTVSRQ